VQRVKVSQIALVRAAILTKRQSGKCAICDIPITVQTSCLDHDHYTGCIRGVLCRNCNGIEGKIKNLAVRGKRNMLPKDYLGRLILYWIHHEEDRTGLLHPVHKTEDEKRVTRNTKARKARVAKKQEK
jgi:hypothetical protein